MTCYPMPTHLSVLQSLTYLSSNRKITITTSITLHKSSYMLQDHLAHGLTILKFALLTLLQIKEFQSVLMDLLLDLQLLLDFQLVSLQ